MCTSGVLVELFLFAGNNGGVYFAKSADFSFRKFCTSYVKIFYSSHIIMLRGALLVFDKQVFNGGIEFFVVDSMILVAAEKKLL